MKLQYLGTAAAEGWPALFCTCDSCKKAKALGGKNIRTRSQALIDDHLLVDFPPDTYLHMLQHGVNLPYIHHVLITHTHEDHLYLSDLALRSKWFANGIQGLLTIYGNDALKKQYDKMLEDTLVQSLLEGNLDCKEIAPFIPVDIGGYAVTPLLANHDKNERCYIYQIEKDGRSMLYGNDTGYFPEETWKHLQQSTLDLVSLDCTTLMHKEGTNHMGIADVLEVQARMLDSGIASDKTQFVATHFSHNGVLLHEEAEAQLVPHGFVVAYDGMVVSF